MEVGMGGDWGLRSEVKDDYEKDGGKWCEW